MKTVNVRQLKNNPSDALRMARKHPGGVMNRDQPDAIFRELGLYASIFHRGRGPR